MSFSAHSVDTPETACLRPVEKFVGTHLFKIMGYSLDKNDIATGDCLESTIFKVGGYDWSICYYPNGDAAVANTYISVFLVLKTTTTDTVKARCIYTIADENEKQFLTSKTTQLQNFSSNGCGWGFSTFVEKDKLESHIKNDCFTIKCTLTVIKVSQVKATSPITVPPGNILQQLGHLLEDGIGADVSFEVDGETFKAHKCILSARSPVFLAQFFGSLKEKSGTIIKIEETGAPVFKSLLHFIYYDSIPEFEETNEGEEEQDNILMVQGLLAAADKYSLERLKIICEKILCRSIEKSNVVTLFSLAERHTVNHLKTACLKFLTSPEVLEEVIGTEKFAYLLGKIELTGK